MGTPDLAWHDLPGLWFIFFFLLCFVLLATVYILRRKTAAESEARQRQAEAETLRQAAAILNSSLSLQVVLTQILAQLHAAIPYDSATVQQMEEDNLIIRAAQGFPDDAALINMGFAVTADLPNALALRTGQPLALANVADSFPYFSELANRYQANRIVSWLGIPLVLDETVLGMITIDRNSFRPFSSHEIALAVAFANHASIALQNAKLYQELAQYSEGLEEAVKRRTLELQRTTEQVEAIFDNSPDAVLLLDRQFQIERVNPAFARLFGYEAEQMRGSDPFSLAVPDDQGAFVVACKTAVSTGEAQQLELMAQDENGRFLHISAALSPIHEAEQVSALVCSFHDISAFKEVERLKDDFVSNVSHELRTPITNLKLHYDLIHLNPARQSTYLEQIGRDIERLYVIIESLLRLSRLDQRRMEINPNWLDLGKMAQQYVLDRASQAETHGLTLQFKDGLTVPKIKADGRLLEQALSILLTNAINYTPAGGQISLGVSCRQIDDHLWIGLSVSDTGPGVDPEEAEMIFNRFFRGETGRLSGVPGTGLGLSIAKEIVALHQGFITLDGDSQGQGSVFTIWLPGPANVSMVNG
jgi:two-component system, OmpR family, phosphate regulon sensor histidine kinase PhoR